MMVSLAAAFFIGLSIGLAAGLVGIIIVFLEEIDLIGHEAEQ